MESRPKEKTSYALPLALGASVLLHVLFMLLSLLLPWTRGTVAAKGPEETTLKFSFAPAADEPAELAGPPPGDPTDETLQQAQAIPQPAVIVPPIQPDRTRQAPPQPQQKPQEEPPPPRRAVEENQPSPDPIREEVAQERAAADLPQNPQGTYRNSPDTSSAAQSEFNVNRALDDFGRALARYREANPPAPAESGRPTHVFVPDLSSVPSSGFGVGNLSFESRDYDWNDYGRQIYMAIWRAWHNRLYQTTDEFEKWAYAKNSWILAHQSQIRFVIQRSGQVTGIVLEAGSDCDPLDVSAVDALAEVILPPLPADFPRDQEVVHARFIARGEIQNLRPTLHYLKHKLNLF